MNLKARINKPWFWISLVGLFLTATGINPETLTSWALLKASLLKAFGNPYALGCFIFALIGQFNNPTTPGLKDGE